MLAAIPAMAQIHYCVVGGKKILTDKPCPGAGTELRPTVNIVQAHSVPEKQSAYGSDGQYQSSGSSRSGDGYACRQAIRNAGVQFTQSRSGSRTESDRQLATNACGYDPFEDQRATESREREMRHARHQDAVETTQKCRSHPSDCRPGAVVRTKRPISTVNIDSFLRTPTKSTA